MKKLVVLVVALGCGGLFLQAAESNDAARNGSEMMNATNPMAASGTAGGERMVFLGNSITLHGVMTSIGWTNQCGMAASAPEKDYVHLTVADLERRLGRKIDYRVQNIADFERGWKTWNAASLEPLVAFKPSLLVVAIGENMANLASEDAPRFEARLTEIINRFRAANSSCRIVLRGVFWANAAKDEALRHVAERTGAKFVVTEDLGRRNEMKAIGLFEHPGVQHHPGDRGMAEIAKRIVEAL